MPPVNLVLDYINEILMEEGMDDAACLQQVEVASNYKAIFSGFHDILCEQSMPTSALLLHPDDYIHVPESTYTNVGFTDPALLNNGRAPRGPFPGYVGHPQGDFQHERSEVDSGSRANLMAYTHDARVSLFSTKADTNITAQNHGNAIIQNDRVSSWAQDAIVEGSRDHIRQEQGTDKLKPPYSDGGFHSKLVEANLSFQDLKLGHVYTTLYVGEDTKSSKHNGDKRMSLAGKGSKFGGKSTPDAQVFADVKEALVSCAQAVAMGDARRANEILQELRHVHGASANGTGLQRTAHIFSKALSARLRGTGEHELRAMSHSTPSAAALLWASKLEFEVSPTFTLMHYFANQSILKAAEGASRLHIVDYGLMHGIQWPCFINALADRKGGPPLLVITGVECSRSGVNMLERLDNSGRRLAAHARSYNVPFQYHAIVSDRWEDLDATFLHCHGGEVLVVNCIKRLNYIHEDDANPGMMDSPRQKLLTRMHSFNPHLLVTAVENVASSPFFVPRFRDALHHYANKFDSLDVLWGDTPQRLIKEVTCFYPEIFNTVACEGTKTLGRPEAYKQWDMRIAKAGFQVLPIPSPILSRCKEHVKQHHHKDCLIDEDAPGWMILGWKVRPTLAVSAWKPST